MKITLSTKKTYTVNEPKGKHLRTLPDIITATDNPTTVAYKLLTILAEPSLTMDELDEMVGGDVLALLAAIKSLNIPGLA